MNNSPSFMPRVFLIACLLFLITAFACLLFYRGLIDPDEGRYMEVAREMVESGNWGEMRLMGYRYYEKPPMSYWFFSAALVSGKNQDWTARVPLLLNLAALLTGIYLLTQRVWAREIARVAILTMLSTIGFALGFSLLITDGLLSSFISLTCILIFWAFYSNGSPGQKIFFLSCAGGLAALGVLTKGAVAFVLPAGIIFFWLLWERRLKSLFTFAWLPAALVFVGLLIPVFLIIERFNTGFCQNFIVQEHFARFLGTREQQVHDEPFWFYIAVLIPLLAPWTLFLPRATTKLYSARQHLDPFSRFCLVWSGIILLFFSCSTGKLASYIFPALPPLLILLGRWGIAEPLTERPWDRRLWLTGLAGLWLVSLALPVVWLMSYFKLGPARLPQTSSTSFLALLPVILTTLALLIRRSWNSRQSMLAMASTLLCGVAILLSPLAGRELNAFLRKNSSESFKKLAMEMQPEDCVIAFWLYRPSLAFYTQRIPYFYQEKNELWYGIETEADLPHHHYLHTWSDLQQTITSAPGRIFAVLNPDNFESFQVLPLKTRPVPNCGDHDTLFLEILGLQQ